MNEKKKSIKIIACIVSACLGLGCAVSSVALAETGVNTAEEIMDNTRYVWNDLHDVDSIVGFLEAVSSGSLPFEVYDKYQDYMNHFASSTATATNSALLAYANASTTGGQNASITIKDSYSFVAKRKIVYPYNDMTETDYLYCYVDKNADLYTPQQFGNYAVSPNTFLLVRDTNFDGVSAYSIPMAQNGITISTAYNDGLYINYDSPNDTFIYESASGTQTVGARHSFENVCKNNSLNTITCTQLVDYYNNFGQGSYNVYIPWGQPLTVFECFAGAGYNYEYSEGFSTYTVGFMPWYFSTGYFNTQYNVPFVVNNTNNNYNTTVINPALPPAYVVPQDDPWHSTNTIDDTTINDYSDYGVTIAPTGLFDFDVNALGVALGAVITPVITGLINGTFALQPDIGLQFGVAPADVNFIQLFNDWLDGITIYPPATRPQVPIITTYTSQQFNLDVFSTTVTYPLEVHQGSNILWSTGQSVIEAVGIPLTIIFGLALFGIAVWFIF